MGGMPGHLGYAPHKAALRRPDNKARRSGFMMVFDKLFNSLRFLALSGSLVVAAAAMPASAQSSRQSDNRDSRASTSDASSEEERGSGDSAQQERRIFSPTSIGEGESTDSRAEADEERVRDEFEYRLLDRTRRVLEPAEIGRASCRVRV